MLIRTSLIHLIVSTLKLALVVIYGYGGALALIHDRTENRGWLLLVTSQLLLLLRFYLSCGCPIAKLIGIATVVDKLVVLCHAFFFWDPCDCLFLSYK